MSSYNLWKNWNIVLKTKKQQDRLKQSFDDEYKPYFISQDAIKGTFINDEGMFICSLEDNFCNCEQHATCINFSNKSVPCSYMYRLAYEKGLINRNGKIEKVSVNKKQTDKSIFDELYHQITKIEKYDIEIQKLKLVKKMDMSGYSFPETLSRTKQGKIRVRAKYDWCLQHPDVVVPILYRDIKILRCSSEISSVIDLIIEYLERKLCDEVIEEYHNGIETYHSKRIGWSFLLDL